MEQNYSIKKSIPVLLAALLLSTSVIAGDPATLKINTM